MYIENIHIKNIRSISEFNLQFPANPAGWHVLIGDNGSGKSTIIRSVALGLIGQDQALGIRPNWNEWLKKNESEGTIQLGLTGEGMTGSDQQMISWINFNRLHGDKVALITDAGIPSWHWEENSEVDVNVKDNWFSAGFGPYRRFTGGTKDYEAIFKSPSLGPLASHLSLFGEDVALTEATEWLKQLQYQHLEGKVSGKFIEYLKTFINSPDFLPHGVQLTEISSDGVFFRDGNGIIINVNQMSDGFRSLLSLTFELIRQLVARFGYEKVFEEIRQGNMYISLPGVVLIDEVDAHLHPTWQTRIGQWFLKYFPNMQFIVTSHSPLVCRACEKGSIWRLAPPGSSEPSGEVTGIERNRLIYGNVLDAYGTEVFGQDVSISSEAGEKLNELAALNVKSMMGEISSSEEERLQELKAILPTENPDGI